MVSGVKLVEAMEAQAAREAKRRGVTLETIEKEYFDKIKRLPGCMTRLSTSLEDAQVLTHMSRPRAFGFGVGAFGLSKTHAP